MSLQNIGNEESLSLTRRALSSSLHPILVHGPSGVGKFRYVKDYFESNNLLHDVINGKSPIDDYRSSIDGVNDVRLSGVNNVIFRDLEQSSDAAKDLLLKYFEEPPAHAKIIVVSSNSDDLGQPILSRFRLKIKWGSINKSDFIQVSSDELAARVSRGNFSLFNSAYGDAKIKSFFDYLIGDDWPSSALCSPPHEILSNKDTRDNMREVLANLFWLASRHSKHKLAFLKLANIITTSGSINVLNHYYAAAASCIDV